MEQNQENIVIVGGGLVGLSQAIALAQEGIAVTIIDKEPVDTQISREFDGRVSAIAWKSYKFLEKIGVWQYAVEYAEPIQDIRVSEFGSSLFLHFDHTEIGHEPFGFIVENRHTRYALHKRAGELANLTIITPAEVVELITEKQQIIVKQADGLLPLTYNLLIAADGKNSRIREFAGIKTTGHKYNQHGIVCTIEHEKPHMGLAHEYFLPVGPFAVLPMQGNRSSLVWSEPGDLTPVYMKMSDEEFNAEITKRVNHLGAVRALPGRWSYPLDLVHADKYVEGNIVLVGDAAHGIHPIAGQGVNLGFRDVILLTELVVNSRKLGLPLNLEQYERVRRLDNNIMIRATHAINRLFSNNIVPVKLVRSLGLGMVNQIAPLRKLFMKYASGK
jgi:2-octaprenyl-6-methoxyphenol hydroxylase